MFHLALELETRLTEWEWHTVPSGSGESVTIDPPEDISPVALHGAVNDFVVILSFSK